MSSADPGPSPTSTPQVPATPASQKGRSWFSIRSPPSIPAPPSPRENASDATEYTGAGETSSGRDKLSSSRHEEAELNDGDDDEVLSVDGDPERTVTKRKSRKRRNDADGQELRMEDLGSMGRKMSEGLLLRLAPDPGGTVFVSLQHSTNMTVHLIVQSHSDRRLVADRNDGSPSAASSTPLELQNLTAMPLADPHIPLDEVSPTERIPFMNKSQPPLPLDRPLPPLPRIQTNHALPDIPYGIVVTPSSPRRASQGTVRSVLLDSPPTSDEGDPTHTESRSRSPSRTPRLTHTAKLSPIGLGLPIGLPQAASAQTTHPPPVPDKQQSVSSSLPSRSASPAAKIAFLEPDGPRDSASVNNDTPAGFRKAQLRRVRSLSEFFGLSPTSNPVSLQPSQPVPKDEQDNSLPVPPLLHEYPPEKAHGVSGMAWVTQNKQKSAVCGGNQRE